MTFTKRPNSQKNFGSRPNRVLSVRVPEDQYETMLPIIKEYVANYREDNLQKIESFMDGIKEVISMSQDIHDYIKKEGSITDSKYLEIFDNHNADLINSLIAEFPIERKTPIKTLTEEKREKELREEELKETIQDNDVFIPQAPIYKNRSNSRLAKKMTKVLQKEHKNKFKIKR